ncbi:hypothetical protein LP419_32695 [Massilia sp. H-1]|nr:hypothetical protein LP419_32695 [Massilia sp. H-1]
MKKLMLTLAISMMFAPAVYAANDVDAALAKLPPFGKDKPIPAPQITKKTLANGLTVWVVPRTGLPRVDFVLAVRRRLRCRRQAAPCFRQHAGQYAQ